MRHLVGLLALMVLAAAMPAAAAETDGALLQGLDKLTAKTFSFEAPINKPVKFGRLEVIARSCVPRLRTAQPERSAFLEIYERKAGQGRAKVFSGWMFASAPSISGMEHPVYDVWVVGCSGVEGDTLTKTVPRLDDLQDDEPIDENAPPPED